MMFDFEKKLYSQSSLERTAKSWKNLMESLTGAQAIIRCLEDLGVQYVFGHPGGAAINIFDALYDSAKIDFILARHEQGAIHMADGYARASGKPGVVLVTSGPGALNTVTGLATAKMDSVPIVVICGQTISQNLGKDAFQESDIFGVTMPLVKHSYLVLQSNELIRSLHESFRVATTGRPGPVVLDIPKDITQEPVTWEATPQMDLPGYSDHSAFRDIDPETLKNIRQAAELLRSSQRPLLLIGHGALISGAAQEVRELAERLQAPVTNTLLAKGAFPENHELSLGMLGMHGNAYANYALTRCDLIMSIGSRFDDRINGNPSRFCPDAKKIHIDIDRSEINKIVKVDSALHGDAKLIIGKLLESIEPLQSGDWLAELREYRRRYPLSAKSPDGQLRATEVIQRFYEATQGEAVVTTDVGQHQMWAAQFFLSHSPDSWISSGGAGTMGFGLPAAIGAQFARPYQRVIAFVGDGGFQMTEAELATAAIHRLPIKIIVLDNQCLGMVRQWQELFYEQRYSGIELNGNPDFVTLAQAYGIRAWRLKSSRDLETSVDDILNFNEGPCLVHAEVAQEDNVYPMIPSGQSAEHIILGPPDRQLSKPMGAT
jgi:acetolactate synthase-1/2/3 large subunit